ncbi:MFS general substrate transporter [Penicillium taxi]|uniref:MFS general substrate transporter n=1 Tax=Penicillium taxi TaxID=168475 RepID=UPI0025459E51|nr:MFS general substrate transporter [Penicillium taxi]KAJ5893244.1 MFS general substrate transporter [Penicillium taxi]
MSQGGLHSSAPAGVDQDLVEKGDVLVDAFDKIGENARPTDPVIERKVLRKIDLFLMPAMMIGYGMVYYDKQDHQTLTNRSSCMKALLGNAAIFGMTTDLHLSVTNTTVSPSTTDTSRLSWATSLFYFGQLAGSYPMTYALQHFNIRYVLGPVVMIWAIICASTAGVTTWRGLFAQRFFLGFTESIIPTCFMVTVSGFYTQSEQALRQSWWWSGTGWFTIIGGAISYGFAQIEGSLHPWQYVFIFAGTLTFLFGFWCFFLPNSPANAWFLTAEERIVAVERLRAGQTGLNNQKIKFHQIKEALLDIKIHCQWGSIRFWAFDCIDFPLGGLSGVGIVFTGWLCSRYRNIRIISLLICCLPVIAGFAMIWKSTWGHKPVTPVVGYSLLGFFGPVVGLIISLGASNVAGDTKRSFTASAVFVAYCVGNIIGPQLIRSQTKSQHYPELWTGLIICYCITILSASALYFLLARENKRRDALNLDENERERLGFQDLTDKENFHFRYEY